jgi:hypothetical protein
MSTQRKLIDFEKRKQLEQQMRTEDAERRRQEVLVKNTQISLHEQSQKEQIARKIAEHQLKQEQDMLTKREEQKTKANAAREKLQQIRQRNEAISKSIQTNLQQKFVGKEIRHLRASKERDSAQELAKQKNDLKREFERKRQQVLERIKKLKS